MPFVPWAVRTLCGRFQSLSQPGGRVFLVCREKRSRTPLKVLQRTGQPPLQRIILPTVSVTMSAAEKPYSLTSVDFDAVSLVSSFIFRRHWSILLVAGWSLYANNKKEFVFKRDSVINNSVTNVTNHFSSLLYALIFIYWIFKN